MTSVNLSLAVVVALFSGFVILAGAVIIGEDECGFLCVEGTYILCDNYTQEFPGCNCVCAPTDGQGCVIYGDDDIAYEDCNN